MPAAAHRPRFDGIADIDEFAEQLARGATGASTTTEAIPQLITPVDCEPEIGALTAASPVWAQGGAEPTSRADSLAHSISGRTSRCQRGEAGSFAGCNKSRAGCVRGGLHQTVQPRQNDEFPQHRLRSTAATINERGKRNRWVQPPTVLDQAD